MKRFPIRYLFTYLWTIPWDIPTWILVLLFRVFFGHRLVFQSGGMWCELRANSWFVRVFYRRWSGTIFGHGGLLAPGVAGGDGLDNSTEVHEDFHVEQFEAAMLVGLINSVVVLVMFWYLGQPINWWFQLGIWMFAWTLSYYSTQLQAFFRGEDRYRGSSMEEAAYSITEAWESDRRKGV